MKLLQRLAALTMATGLTMVPMIASAAGPAHADRCEPEELVLGAGTSPINENDNPVCWATINYVYPFICDDFTTAVTCAGSISPNPNYRPDLVFFQPDPNRLYCGLYTFVVPTGGCAFNAAAAPPVNFTP
jgi:hypothetical protein